MKKDGKKLEKIVRLIQETLKDSANTIIHSNYKISNTSNRGREIDILIESKINDFEIKIAIECKEYKNSVSVEKIEAFEGKCSRIKAINKKVFVSEKGYQIDAINAAKEFGIELYNIQDIDHSVIQSWLPIKQLGLRFTVKDIVLFSKQEDDDSKQIKLKERLFHFQDARGSQQINPYIDQILLKAKNFLWNYTLLEFMKRNNQEPERKVSLDFQLPFNNVYIIDVDNNQIPLKGIEASVDLWLIEKEPIIQEFNALAKINGEIKANNLKIDLGGNENANIIVTEGKTAIYQTDKNGVTKELQTLATYDPKTDELKIINQSK